jgi:hypothetical protein
LAHVGKSVVPDRGTGILPVKCGTDTGWKPVPPPDSPHEPDRYVVQILIDTEQAAAVSGLASTTGSS